ncbi:MAG: translation initiation factor IF-2 subunit beta [Halobacteriales archaeon]
MSDYEEQLERGLSEVPDIGEGGSRSDLPTPDVRQEGNVTVYENFQATLDKLDRDDDQLLRFLQDELGTSAHIDESGRARLTGEFRSDRIHDAVEEFNQAYVICPECGLPDTQLVEEKGAQMLKCDACGALSPTGS